MKKCEAFISCKDHKENFENNPKCRLVNPAKSDSGKISKLILDKVNTNLRTILNVNQWKNTQNVIEWFNSTEQKSRHSFISFDIVDFIPQSLKIYWIKHCFWPQVWLTFRTKIFPL